MQKILIACCLVSFSAASFPVPDDMALLQKDATVHLGEASEEEAPLLPIKGLKGQAKTDAEIGNFINNAENGKDKSPFIQNMYKKLNKWINDPPAYIAMQSGKMEERFKTIAHDALTIKRSVSMAKDMDNITELHQQLDKIVRQLDTLSGTSDMLKDDMKGIFHGLEKSIGDMHNKSTTQKAQIAQLEAEVDKSGTSRFVLCAGVFALSAIAGLF
eukprot:gnl/TRDRNA2_/TRDRNA2_183529_c0_seq1.p1 gnl/TRDRNA2_/TRDRNA2_183529_c0~~gnl/TRDRNA2_/TRDRNA2_183529_c0_seq1.p1  ORF type:complete len:215 (+),score=58.45 gnl/TRDRNA2_/TRDRNA2_183529_c0_seq1:88-732(+)